MPMAAGPREVRAAVLADTGVADLLRQPLQRISGGEFQRVLLARALLRDPDLLVLDEPAQSLDITGRSEFYRLIARVKERRGCGVLLVSHNLHLVMAAADQVVCLNRHVCCTGRPQDVRRDPAYRALFRARLAEAALEDIREATNKAWVLGDDRFKAKVERLAKRRAAPKARGGDRKSKAFREAAKINRV